MSSRNEAAKDETRELESSDEEHPINPDVRILSRILGVHRASVASMPGTSGGGGAAGAGARAPATGARRNVRQERDRLFWTLLGNRTPSNRSRGSGARAPRPTMFADLLEPERRRARTAALCRAMSPYTTPAAYKPSTSFTSVDSTLRNMLRRRTQDRLNASSSGNGTGASSSPRPQMIVVHARGCAERPERAAAATDGDRTRPPDDTPISIVVAGPETPEPMFPLRSRATEFFSEQNRRAEEPLNMSTGAMSLEEEILEVEPELAPPLDPAPAPPPCPAADDVEADPAEESASVSAETSQQTRGTKRKRDREVAADTHESVSTLNQSILRLLECPVCMEWMEPPIAQCRRGHLVCGACRKRLDTCPVCRSAFSSVRNRAMEDVASILRYPCRHGCGRAVRAARRARHEASCAARRHACPLPACRAAPPMPRAKLRRHCQTKHPESFKTGCAHSVSLVVSAEQQVQWVVGALGALFHVRVAVDARAWGVCAHAAHLGPVDQAARYTYEVTVNGRHNGRRLMYRRTTHSDLENFAVNTSRQDCFHLTLDQALNYLRYKNDHSETDKTLELTITLALAETEEEVIADSG